MDVRVHLRPVVERSLIKRKSDKYPTGNYAFIKYQETV